MSTNTYELVLGIKASKLLLGYSFCLNINSLSISALKLDHDLFEYLIMFKVLNEGMSINALSELRSFPLI